MPIINKYGSQTTEEFRQSLSRAGLTVRQNVSSTLLSPNGIYVSPETNNTFIDYTNGATEDFRFEQFVTSYYQDLALTAEFYAAVFVVELPRPTVPIYISSRTTFTFNSLMQLSSVLVLKGIQKVKLEGDFSEFFTVYSRDDHALDAFTTVVPNLMLEMLSKGSNFDVEFADRYVYFYRLYSPTYTGRQGVRNCKIGFDSNDYIEMRNFGLKYGKMFARAARPSDGDSEKDLQPLWQIVNNNQAANTKSQLIWLAGIIVYIILFFVLWYIVIPLSVLIVGFRFIQWRLRKNRLISNWKNRT